MFEKSKLISTEYLCNSEYWENYNYVSRYHESKPAALRSNFYLNYHLTVQIGVNKSIFMVDECIFKYYWPDGQFCYDHLSVDLMLDGYEYPPYNYQERNDHSQCEEEENVPF